MIPPRRKKLDQNATSGETATFSGVTKEMNFSHLSSSGRELLGWRGDEFEVNGGVYPLSLHHRSTALRALWASALRPWYSARAVAPGKTAFQVYRPLHLSLGCRPLVGAL